MRALCLQVLVVRPPCWNAYAHQVTCIFAVESRRSPLWEAWFISILSPSVACLFLLLAVFEEKLFLLMRFAFICLLLVIIIPIIHFKNSWPKLYPRDAFCHNFFSLKFLGFTFKSMIHFELLSCKEGWFRWKLASWFRVSDCSDIFIFVSSQKNIYAGYLQVHVLFPWSVCVAFCQYHSLD